MTDEQKVLIQLLKEFDEICEEQGYTYFLTAKYTLEAVRSGGFENEKPALTVFMHAEDCLKFAEYFEKNKKKNRFLESLMNNDSFPRLCMNYGDTETLDFNTASGWNYKYSGIHITIEVLRPFRNKVVMRTDMLRECAWETYINNKSGMPKRKMAYSGMTALTGVAGKSSVARSLFKALTKGSKDKTDRFFYKRYWSIKRIPVDGKWIRELKKVKFEDAEVYIPADYDTYLTNLIHRKWRESDFSEQVFDPALRFIDAHLPFRELFDEIEAEGLDTDEIRNAQKQFIESNKKVGLCYMTMKYAWRNLFLCGDRYEMWEEYEPKKDQLRQLYEAGDFDKLEEELEDYINAVDINRRRRGLGLCFDKEIFEMFAEICRRSGKGEYAEDVRSRVPEKHWDPITLTTYDGEPCGAPWES